MLGFYKATHFNFIFLKLRILALLLVLRRLPFSTIPKVKERGKKPVKPKNLPSLSSDEDHPTPSVDVLIITSTPVELSPDEPPAEPPARKEK